VSWQPAVAGIASLPIVFTDGAFADRRRLWTRAMERAGIDVSDSTAAAIASRFQFPARDIELAASTARYLATLDGRPEPEADKDVVEAARRLVGDDFGSLGSKISRRCGWNDLVLSESTLARLRELSAAIELRHLVFDEWGFSQRTTAGAGVVALFAGASGTGKTMTAAVIANELGFDLYRIDLSSVVSKYIGETEKNLDRIFRAARSGHVMLFFDEADALFGKRSEVKDAHDRYANIEVAFLLQRLEEHDGVVVLATNLRRNVDEAFARRMQFVIEFAPPDPALREELWRTIFPGAAPMADDIDWAFLAKTFSLTGGEIRNVALDAAFLAARDGGTIAMPDIIRAMARQVVKQGKMPSGSEFGAYFPLVTGMP
jgi:SpoVK/Ycf46/Vps4 family AAA+-type ATPase